MPEHSWPPDVIKQAKRQCRRSDGRLKRRLTRVKALEAAARIDASAYCCSVCGWWHVGKVKP